jgi:hypothetical protein
MPRRDYSEDDDYYTQDFRRDGVVSIWIGLSQDSGDQSTDVLQDLCGVGYYSLDELESNCHSFDLTGIARLLEEISHSASFIDQAVQVAAEKNLSKARWVTVQFDFAYEPGKVKRPIADDPVFLGVFRYIKE